MAKKKKKAGDSAVGGADGGCCSLKPQPGDEPLEPTDTAESVMARVQLACDDDTGVFFFRHKGKLFLRIVEVG